MTQKRSHKSFKTPFADVHSDALEPQSTGASKWLRHKWIGGLLLLCVAGWFLVQRSRQLDNLASFERDGTPILEAAVSWRAQHKTLGCPTLSQLIQDRFLPKSAQQGGQRFRILCSADEVHVEQLGEDGKPMADDALRLNQRVAPQEG
jgi:hypothetical protein